MANERFNFQWNPTTGVTAVQQEEPTQEGPSRDEIAAELASRSRPRTEPFDGSLTQRDLLQIDNLNTIRAYMVDRKGVQYRDMEPEEVIDDFMEQQRYFNANMVSTAGEVRFIANATDEQKQRAAAAYELYDQLGSVFSNDGFFGAVEGIGEYIFAAASDPTNYISMGLGSLAGRGVTAASRAAITQAAKEAGERALASGATREAADQAARRAADRTIQRLAHREVTGSTAQEVAARVAEQERNMYIRRAATEAGRDITQEGARRTARASLYGTTALDSTFAAVQDYQIQNLMIDVGLQEEYSRTQTALSSLLGAVGGGMQLAGGAFRGASGLGEGKLRLEEARVRSEQDNLIRTALNKEEIDTTIKTIDDAVSSWEQKVARGRAEFGETGNTPADLLYEIMLGEDGRGGLAKIMRDKGIRITRNRLVSDVMTDIIKQLPAERLAEINAKIEPRTGLTLGESAGLGQRLGDLFAKDINVAGRTLNVMSQVKKTINGGVVHGNNMMDAMARRADVEEAVDKEMGILNRTFKTGQYMQSVWRRLLVSSPATSMVNVAGYTQFSVGQSIADMFNAGTLMLSGLARGGNLTAKGAEHLRLARVYTQIQAQKMRNFADPFTTHDTYMALLAQNKELEKRLFESFTGGVDRAIAKFNLDPNSKGLQLTESITNGANMITGVRIQDSFTKSQMFITELDKALRINKDMTLDDVLARGTIDDIFDDDVINPALDSTLKSVYSKNYTTDDQLLKDVAKLVEGISNTPVLGTVLPFGRFLNNTVATVHQWGPTGFFPAMFRIMKKEADAGNKIMAREAFARAVVGNSALALAAAMDEERQREGLAYNEIKLSDGTIIDARNTFPFSMFLAAGRIINLKWKGEPVPEELSVEFGTQIGVGQAASDLQFGNDMIAAYDALFNLDDGQSRANLGKSFTRAMGNYVAGYTRPLDAVNKLVGYIDNSDAARDLRQAEGVELFTQASTRYLDNIFEAMFDKVDSITGEELRVATREGPVRDANPLARVFGLTIRPTRTATEQAYSMANMAEWTASQRSNMPEYDRIFNELIAPRLETEMDTLIRDERFVNGDANARKIMVNERLRRIRSSIRDYMNVGGGGPESNILSLRRTASRMGNKQQREMAINAMRENFNYEGGGVDEMSIRELQYFMSYMDYLDVVYR
jgi:hypothetical protein